MEIRHTLLHTSGIQLRLSPFYRRGVYNNTFEGSIVKQLMTTSPVIGRRGELDQLPYNVVEVLRLKKIAKEVTGDMQTLAESMNSQRYAVLLYGSVALGLARNNSREDRSDIDIDLVMDNPPSKDDISEIKIAFQTKYEQKYQTKVNIYIQGIANMATNQGFLPRIYIRSGAQRLLDKGNVWKEIFDIGIDAQTYLNLNRRQKIAITSILRKIVEEDKLEITDTIKNQDREIIFNYLNMYGLLTINNDQQQKALRLLDIYNR